MYSRTIIGFTLAAGSAAFMVRPNGDLAFNIISDAVNTPLQTFGVDPYTSVVRVPCSGPAGLCPLARFDERTVLWVKGQESHLALNISVSLDSKTLEWNGVPIFPPRATLGNNIPEVLQVPGPIEEPENNIRLANPARTLRATSWAVRTKTIDVSSETKEEIIELQLSVYALEQQSILIHDVVVGLVRDEADNLLILASGVSKEAPQKLCQKMPVLCQLRDSMSNTVDALKHKIKGKVGCHKHHDLGMLGHGKHPHRPHHKVNQEHTPRPERPHHHKTHHYHNHQQMHSTHRFMDKVARVLLNIVIPLLLGILAGMVTYLIGLTVGTVLALAWMKFRRYRRGDYTPVSLDENNANFHDEEKGRFADEKEHVQFPIPSAEVDGTESGQK